MKHPYTVRPGALEPDDHEARQHLAGIPPGERVLVRIERERYPQFADLVYVTFRLVGNAMGWRARNTRGWLAIKTGRADVVRWPHADSRALLVPHGTGPSDMGSVELEAFWDEARVVIADEVLPFVDEAAREQIKFRIEEGPQ